MSIKIVLMRSIVIGGQRVKMSDARALVERVGGTDVRSIIATGNLLFRSSETPRALEGALEAACESFYGRPTEMVVKTAEQWRSLLAANPFPEEAKKAPSRLLVWAMRSPLPDNGLEQMRRRAHGEERIARTPDGDFYVWFGEGKISDSKIPAGFSLKALGAVGTNRNWNTALKIAQALEAMNG
ncbi:uncharacterized protein (DUF1697 family) [Microvirga flocculans]|uniref:Uncharacterized protein (DUF1697 family) n=1 Tax=Microvirga flocculans TaxID=217168 RepID=A0A7W6N903_9HYPH|nr:DUF1697 domain-containing protein [Microvirga flocculans]MBB4040968.1 uncharacterized protein (DUF1697 family) [Microvirga flocculans]